MSQHEPLFRIARSAGRWFLSGIAVVCAASAFAAAAVREERAVRDFHAVDVAVAGEVVLRRGAETRLSIEALPATLEQIVTEVRDGSLRIYRAKGSGWWRPQGPIRIDIVYRSLDALVLSGSADTITDRIDAESFSVEISGSADVVIPGMALDALRVTVSGSGDLDVAELTADSVAVAVSGSGDVTLAGTAGRQTVEVRGSGTVDTEGLRTTDGVIRVSGSGNVTVWATGTLDAEISGSGNIVYRGEPTLESRISGSGRLRAR